MGEWVGATGVGKVVGEGDGPSVGTGFGVETTVGT